jgi:hypothetical protein
MFTISRCAALTAALLLPVAANAGQVRPGFPAVAPRMIQTVRPALPRPHIMLPFGHYAAPPPTSALVYHGGLVTTPPKLYVVYWGWTSDPQKVKPYLNKFLKGVGGSSWLSTDTQYYSTSQGNIANPTGQLAGTWNDTTAIPNTPTDSQIQAEAAKSAAHFGGVNTNASYVVATPHGHSSAGFGTSYCAYHGITASSVAYTNLPYMPDAGANCGAFIVKSQLDGVSIVEGHEYAETQTDPGLNAWWDPANGEEIGDLCAWTNITVIKFSTGSFAVQPLWSNAANGCVL